MLYIPPTQNPFLAQSMGLLQNIGLMYLGHSLKQQDTEKQQAYQKQLMQEEGQTKMQLAGYTPASGYDQAEAGGQQPAGQVTAYGQAYKRPDTTPKLYEYGGAKFIADREGKLTQIKSETADKLPSSDMQALADLRKTNPNATIEDLYKLQEKFKQKPGTPSFGMSIDPTSGEVRVTSGEGAQGMTGGMPLTPAARNKAQTDIFDIDLSIQNLKNVAGLYKPEFQQMATKWQNAISAGKEKWLGQNLDPSEKKDLVDYTNYRKAAVGMYSEEIAKGGGKTLTPFEVKIYGGKLPNAGTGMFDGDSPTEFESGMKQMYSTLMKSKARMMWYQAQGLGKEFAKNVGKNLPPEKAGLISLEDMDKVINNRAAQLERDLKMASPNANPQQITDMVKKTIQKEFFGETQ